MTSPQKAPQLPSPPFYSIPNLNNLRDAAHALTTSSGQPLKTGLLFRSAEVSRLDRAGWAAVHRLGIRTVFDLRSQPEVEKGWRGITGEQQQQQQQQQQQRGNEDVDVRKGWEDAMRAEGVHRVWVPVFEADDYSPERLAERYVKYMAEGSDGFVQAYADIMAHAGRAFGRICRALTCASEAQQRQDGDGDADAARGAVLVHCTAGKDRTGVFFGVLFSFLGVPQEQIAEEYHLTEQGLAHVREAIAERLVKSPGFKKYTLSLMAGRELSAAEIAEEMRKTEQAKLNGTEEEGGVQVPPEILEKGRQAALRMVGAKRGSILGALEYVERTWGSAEGYLREVCELGDGELEGLRRALVVDG